MTVLHAGGKFGGGGYKVSGGLHGVGASVVNALSEEMWVEVVPDADAQGKQHAGKIYRQDYERASRRTTSSRTPNPRPTAATGTTVSFKPDSDIFESARLRLQTIAAERLREMAYLTKGVWFHLFDERDGREQ